ncbi:MAG: DHH family phosphoesterase [Clostridia bacterium]|nr:DHH family phosphoesterase [Clostridia bacterium]
MNIGLPEAWKTLCAHDDILLLTHRLPDGDAVGSLFALYEALSAMGKRVRYLLDTPPQDVNFLVREYTGDVFEPLFVVTVDVADRKLVYETPGTAYGDRVDLSIDHHASNNLFARQTLVLPEDAAAAEVLFELFTFGGVRITPRIADCLYTGIATDTGCFRYPNTTAATLRAAAALVDAGADNGRINTDIFETKSLAYVEFEASVMRSVQMFLDNRCAVATIPLSLFASTGVTEADAKAVNALPRQIEGVLAGVTVKERPEGGWRISVRTRAPLSASEICKRFGGGGHALAAGCELDGDLQTVVPQIVKAVEQELTSKNI